MTRLRRAAWGLGTTLLVLAILEVALRLSPFSPPSRDQWSRSRGLITVERFSPDPRPHFVRLQGQCGPDPVFTPTGNSRRDTMARASFACEKAPGTQRIVVLGESSVQGYGLEAHQALPARLQGALARQGGEVEVLNGGVAGTTTPQIVSLFREMIPFGPDLVILYAGHNNFLYYDVLDAALRTPPSALAARRVADRLALYRGLSTLLREGGWVPGGAPAASDKPHVREPHPPARSRDEHARRVARREEAWERISQMYASNVAEIQEDAREAGARLVLVTPVCALDHPPPASEHGRWLEPDVEQRWRRSWEGVGVGASRTPTAADLPALQAAVTLDGTWAQLRFLAGQAAWASGDRAAALDHWHQALDAIPADRSDRAPWRFGDVVVDVGRELGVPVVDLRPTVDRLYLEGPPTPSFFLDPVHPSEEGARALAEALGLGVLGL